MFILGVNEVKANINSTRKNQDLLSVLHQCCEKCYIYIYIYIYIYTHTHIYITFHSIERLIDELGFY